MKSSIFISALLVASVLSATTAYAQEVCTCRSKGISVPEGQSACLKTSEGYKIAQCEKVLNNTSWKISKKACAVS